MSDTESEMRAILTRAATVEAQRQAAAQRGEDHAAREYELELSRLWARHADLERQCD
jgi:hypothetical protein